MPERSRSPLVIRTVLVPKRFCVNVFGMILTRNPDKVSPRVVNHERIHTAQMRELLFVGFYILYFFEWLFRLLQTRQWYTAYMVISFEREAYANDSNPGYLASRHHYAQWRRSASMSKSTVSK